MELTRRTDEEPVRARSQSVRIQFGIGGRGRRQPGLRGDRHRDQRQHHLSGVGERRCRSQADGRSGEPQRHHPDRRHPGHGRTDWPHRRRRRGAAGRDGRRRRPDPATGAAAGRAPGLHARS